MNIVEKEISKEASAKVAFKDSKIQITTSYEGAGFGAELTAHVSVDYFLDELAKAIPGQMDDVVINVLKIALKAV